MRNAKNGIHGQKYREIIESVRPDVLIEDNCKSIGGSWQMCITNTSPEIKRVINSIVVKEFKGIDHLPDLVQNLFKMKAVRNTEYLNMIDRSMKQIKQGKVVVKTMEELDKAAELDENFLEISLPKYLKDDIDALMKGYENNSTLLDCLYCEVQGSINSALYGNEITEEQAIFLRKKYLGLEG